MYAFIPHASGSLILLEFAMRMTPTRIASQAILPKCSARSCDSHIFSYLLFSLTDCVILGISTATEGGVVEQRSGHLQWSQYLDNDADDGSESVG